MFRRALGRCPAADSGDVPGFHGVAGLTWQEIDTALERAHVTKFFGAGLAALLSRDGRWQKARPESGVVRLFRRRCRANNTGGIPEIFTLPSLSSMVRCQQGRMATFLAWRPQSRGHDLTNLTIPW